MGVCGCCGENSLWYFSIFNVVGLYYFFCIKKCRESTLEKLWGKGKTFCWKIGNELTGAMVGVPVAMLIPAIGLEIAPRAWIGAGPGITPTPWMRPLGAAVAMACCWWWEAEGAEIDMIPDMGGIDLCAF